MKVTHKQIYIKGVFGGIANTTLCGRVSDACVDANVADGEEKITCKLCLRIQADPEHWQHKQVLTKAELQYL